MEKRKVINAWGKPGVKMFKYRIQNGEIVTFPGTKKPARYIPFHTPMVSVEVERGDVARELIRNRAQKEILVHNS